MKRQSLPERSTAVVDGRILKCGGKPMAVSAVVMVVREPRAALEDVQGAPTDGDRTLSLANSRICRGRP
jgi:hypothetical protein